MCLDSGSSAVVGVFPKCRLLIKTPKMTFFGRNDQYRGNDFGHAFNPILDLMFSVLCPTYVCNARATPPPWILTLGGLETSVMEH